ncbi:DUF6083 domain-containing protein [Streptomyces longwoodensis]|uniref:DUF6083 domain-containing protein n=1 Tax=Streptomyces longwoodensis TaxID=68231 RepID=UPI0033F2AC45
MSGRFNWDGSAKDDSELVFGQLRTMRVHRSNPSTLLRQDAIARCRYCGEPMEYFDRHDHGRIPMFPKQLPSARFPVQMRWHVLRGIAMPGDGGEDRCYIPHPAICAAVEHTDSSTGLTHARASMRRRFEARLKDGFIPALRPSDEQEVAEQHIEPVEGLRHVIAYSSLLYLAPGKIEDLQCVAVAYGTGERCRNGVSQEEGRWDEVEIPYVAGRAGQDVLWAGSTMWVYTLHTLYPEEIRRWMRQRCPHHAPGTSSAPDAVPPQWTHFDPWRHSEYILRDRPTHLEPAMPQETLLSGLAAEPKRTECAVPDCRNGSVSKVPKGWLCYRCAKKQARRAQTHRRWTGSED